MCDVRAGVGECLGTAGAAPGLPGGPCAPCPTTVRCRSSTSAQLTALVTNPLAQCGETEQLSLPTLWPSAGRLNSYCYRLSGLVQAY